MVIGREVLVMKQSEAVDYYLSTCRMEGLSPRTIEWYGQKLSALTEFLDPPLIKNLILEDARRFVAHLFEQDIQPQTIHGYVRSTKAFGSWLEREGYTSDHLFAELKPPRVPKKLIQVLAEDEIKTMLKSFKKDTPGGARGYAICALLLDTGMRSGELCGIRVEDVDFQRGLIKVNGRGAKERMVPFAATAKKALQRYVPVFRPEPAICSQCPTLFGAGLGRAGPDWLGPAATRVLGPGLCPEP